MLDLDGFVMSLDTPEPIHVNGKEYYVQGWCFPKSGFEAAEIVIKVDGVCIPAFTSLERPDVARYFNNPDLDRCGFLARFPQPLHGNEVSLIAKTAVDEVVLVERINVPRKIAPLADPSKVGSYSEWLERREPLLFWKEDEVEDRIAALAWRPLVSIILPTYNTPPYFLKRCIESIREQHYPYWQLCVADDCSDNDQPVLSYLHSVAARDERIQVNVRKCRGGISAASNTALESAKGEFVVLLDHDDELHPFALTEIARTLSGHEDSDLIYSDEDKIDRCGLRSHPAFKPDFDRDVFLSFNYLGHLVALRRDVMSRIGGFRSRCDGAQDWDVLLRAVEAIDASDIRHVRKPLYHWRMHDESTAMNLDAKPYVAKAWTTVLEDHFERTGPKVRVMNGLFYGSMRIKYPASRNTSIGVFVRPEDGAFQASVVRTNLTQRKATVYQAVGCAVHALLVDGHEAATVAAAAGGNGVTSTSYPRSLCSLTELRDEAFVFINGQLDSLNHLFFEELAAQAMRDDCGLVTGISLDSEGRTIHTGWVRGSGDELIDPFAGIEYPHHAYMGQLSVVRSVEAISHLFFAVRREHLAAVGGLGSVSSAQMPRLVRLLTRNAIDKRLRILFTPYAIATFCSVDKEPSIEPLDRENGDSVKLNPNLLDFKNSTELLHGRI